MSVKVGLGACSFWTSSPCEWEDNAEKGNSEKQLCLWKGESPPDRTKLVWPTAQGGNTVGSSIYVTQLLFCLPRCTGTVEDGQRAMSVLSCHQFVVHWMGGLDGTLQGFLFHKSGHSLSMQVHD